MTAVNTERLKRLSALLDAALALPVAERAAWLAALPADARALKPDLLALLGRAGVETDTFLRDPVALPADFLHEGPRADRSGDRVGPWRLLAELGSGGMATVWLAERADGGLQRQVALKLPRVGWAPGLAERMARERDILAALEHPRIARLYDAGVTAEGRPWLAMEHIEGVPIDAFCREQSLDVHDRLRLVLQVADAVAHAHARLVVHRDLKPSNILVTAAGEVRLLDFGVAKLLESDAPSSGLTQHIGAALTPDYASPEQVAGRTVGVATDVYSLGVVLYELLTGERPYRLGRQSTAALEEAILAADVPRASTRTTDSKTARALRGDLDAVLAKALAKRPVRRYPSIEAFAADLQRHLDGLPVQAQAPSWRYRARKFIGRHRLVLAGATLLVASVVAGLAGTLWQARRAAEQARIAQHERDRALEQLRIAEASDEQLRVALAEAGGRKVSARDIAERVEKQVLQRYRDDPLLRARLLLQLGSLYLEAGVVDDAARATTLGREAAASAGNTTLTGHADCQQAALLAIVGRNDEARSLLPRARAALSPATPDNAAERLDCHAWASQMQMHLDDLDATRAEAEAGLRLIDPSQPAQRRLALVLHDTLAQMLGRRGEYGPAIAILRRVREEQLAMGLGGTSAEEAALHNLAYVQSSAGQPLAAWQAFEGLRARTRAAGGEDDPVSLSAYARTLNQLGRHADAAALARRSLAMARELKSQRGIARNLMLLAVAACRGRIDVACAPAVDEAERAAHALQGARTQLTIPHHLRAEAALGAGRADEALAHFQKALATANASSDRDPTGIRLQTLLARIELKRGDVAAARAAADRAVQEGKAMAQGLDHADYLGAALAAQAEVLDAQGERAAARAAHSAAVKQLEAALGADAPATQRVRQAAPRATP